MDIATETRTVFSLSEAKVFAHHIVVAMSSYVIVNAGQSLYGLATHRNQT